MSAHYDRKGRPLTAEQCSSCKFVKALRKYIFIIDRLVIRLGDLRYRLQCRLDVRYIDAAGALLKKGLPLSKDVKLTAKQVDFYLRFQGIIGFLNQCHRDGYDMVFDTIDAANPLHSALKKCLFEILIDRAEV